MAVRSFSGYSYIVHPNSCGVVYNNNMKYGNLNLKYGLLLAPLAGVTDRSYRSACFLQGAELCFTEMVSAKGVVYRDETTIALADTRKEPGRCAIQIFGSDPDVTAEAASYLCGLYHSVGMDIKMGCPMKKIVSNGDGSALMKDPVRAARIVNAVKKAVSVPVSVKFRTGWDADHRNAVEFAKRLADAGADLLTVHGRTREQIYADPVDYLTIEKVRNAVDGIVLIGNGGIFDRESAKRMAETGVDGLMLARGTMGNPWLFADLAAMVEGREYEYPSPSERLQTALAQFEEMIADKGEFYAVREGRRQIGYYLKGLRGASAGREILNRAEKADQIRAVILSVIDENV